MLRDGEEARMRWMWVTVIGCGAPSPEVAAIVALVGDPAAGEEPYRTECVACHAEDARGNSRGPDLVAELDEGEVRFVEATYDGIGFEMPAYRDRLTGQQIKDVYAYVSSL